MNEQDKREKVIKALECCTKKGCIYKDTEKECPYWELCGEYEDSFEDCTTAMSKDALALLKAQEQKCRECGEATSKAIQELQTKLKAQEAKPPVIKENSYGWKFYYCPSCGKEFYQNNKFSFCEKCGQAVKWE